MTTETATTETTETATTTEKPATTTETTTTEAPQFDWRKEIAGEDQKTFKELERVPDLKALHKLFVDNRNALRDSGRIKHPGKDATDEDRKAFAKAIGVPDKADGYKIDLKTLLPDGMELDETDNKNLKQITELLYAEGGMSASPETVRSAHKLYIALKESEIATQLANQEATKKATETALRSEWGASYKANMDFANGAVSALFGGDEAVDEVLNWTRDDGSRLGDNATFMKAMMAAGRALAIDPVFAASMNMHGDAKTTDQRIQEIQAYRNGTAEQKREYDKLSQPGGELEQLYAKRQALRDSPRAA